ncbi:MAG: rod shape-determining protein MreC [Prevotellaceae bacterium]|jgi:rod shape-determining protein MreC|nr:rod shape-determining protein MreC [Prevotellaceae bacterium]
MFKFFQKYSTFLIFLLLESVAFALIANQSVFQKSLFAKSVIEVTASFYNTTNNITQYFWLKNDNKKLSAENAELQRKVKVLEKFIAQKNYENTLDGDSVLIIIPVKIVYKTVDKINNYMIINKGRKDGIRKDMSVVSANSVVGVVQTVSDNYAVVISVLSQKLKISGKLQKADYLCSIFWNGQSPRKCNIENIPDHVAAAVGDTIVTSGYSSIFPENVVVGTIKKITLNPSTAWNNIEIEYATDFMTVSFVNVVANARHNELNSLQQSLE